MKRLIIILISISLFQNSYAQNDRVSQNFIRAVITGKGVIYSDSLDKHTLAHMISSFNYIDKRTHQLREFRRIDTPSMNIVFTNEEKSYVNLELHNMKFNGWGKDLLENSICVPADTVNKIFGDNKKFGWPYFEGHYGRALYRFSKPIFLRNGTLCLFYQECTCEGRCSEGYFYIYLKINGAWKPVCMIYEWAV